MKKPKYKVGDKLFWGYEEAEVLEVLPRKRGEPDYAIRVNGIEGVAQESELDEQDESPTCYGIGLLK